MKPFNIEPTDQEIANEVMDELTFDMQLIWDIKQNAVFVAEMPKYRECIRNKTKTQKQYAKDMISRYPDFFPEGEDFHLGRVHKHLPYMDKVLGAKVPRSKVGKESDYEHYYGILLDKHYKGEVFEKFET